MRSFLKLTLAIATYVLFTAASALAQGTLHVYGPGGPAPAMQEAAKAFATARQRHR